MLLTTFILGGIVLILFIYGLNLFIKQVQINLKVYKAPGPPGNLITGNVGYLTDAPGLYYSCFSSLGFTIKCFIEIVFKSTRQHALAYYPIYKVWILNFTAINLLSPYDFEVIRKPFVFFLYLYFALDFSLLCLT